MNAFQISNLKYQIRKHRGFTLLELSVAGVLLAAAMVVSVQILGWIALERRAADRRQWATQEVSNVMEHLATRHWDDLTPETADGVQLSRQAQEVLPGAELHADVTSAQTEPGVRRITVELKWRNRAGEFDAPVRLTTWVYRRGGTAQ